MNDVRLWVVLLALTSFLAGLSAGLFLGAGGDDPRRSDQPFADYRSAFVERFALDARRAELFDELLRNYHSELESARAGVLAQSRPQLEPQLEGIGARYRDAIRDHVLPPGQRAQFEQLASAWKTIQ